jgi:response regulator RpfG family c-di-GMP phosphodiesterase
VQEIFVAGLLHNIGKIAFSDELLALPVTLMKGEALGLYRKHPLLGEQLLTALDDLRGAATILRSQMERFDGEGFPDHLSGLAIPIGARILALASDYDDLQIGALAQRRLRPDEAIKLIMQNSGKRYDPQVVKAFIEIINGGVEETLKEIELSARELQSGMVLSRDLFTNDGLLLLPADHVLDHRLIQQIMTYDVGDDTRLKIYVRVERKES